MIEPWLSWFLMTFTMFDKKWVLEEFCWADSARELWLESSGHGIAKRRHAGAFWRIWRACKESHDSGRSRWRESPPSLMPVLQVAQQNLVVSKGSLAKVAFEKKQWLILSPIGDSRLSWSLAAWRWGRGWRGCVHAILLWRPNRRTHRVLFRCWIGNAQGWSLTQIYLVCFSKIF